MASLLFRSSQPITCRSVKWSSLQTVAWFWPVTWSSPGPIIGSWNITWSPSGSIARPWAVAWPFTRRISFAFASIVWGASWSRFWRASVAMFLGRGLSGTTSSVITVGIITSHDEKDWYFYQFMLFFFNSNMNKKKRFRFCNIYKSFRFIFTNLYLIIVSYNTYVKLNFVVVKKQMHNLTKIIQLKS